MTGSPHDGVPYDPAPDEFDADVMVQPVETITVSYGMFSDGAMGVWTNACEVPSTTLALGMLEQAKIILMDNLNVDAGIGPVYPDDTLDDDSDYDE